MAIPEVSSLIRHRPIIRLLHDALIPRRVMRAHRVSGGVCKPDGGRDSSVKRTNAGRPRDYAWTDFSQQLPSSTTLNCKV